MFAWQPLNWDCVLLPKRKVLFCQSLSLLKLQLFFSTVLKCVNSYGDGLYLPVVQLYSVLLLHFSPNNMLLYQHDLLLSLPL